jgi:nitrogen fixation protein NifU and related proteins
MSDELDDLYREVILDHTKRPRNFRAMPDANRSADGHNRLCGDKLRLFVKVEDGVIKDVAFQGSGCSISTASASIMSEMLKGKPLDEAQHLFEEFHKVVTGPPDEIPDVPEDLGKLAAFAGVRKFPVRVKCATLSWHTLQAALKDDKKPVSTE